jgi:hypothetical protein
MFEVMRTPFLVLLVVVICFSNCGNSNTNADKKQSDDSYQTISLQQSFDECAIGDENCAYSRALFPLFQTDDTKFLNGWVWATIRHAQFTPTSADARPDSLEQALADFVSHYATFKQEFEDSEHIWFRDVSVVANRPKAGIVTLEYQKVEFEGGAHELKQTIFQNFDLKAKQQISLSDLFDETGLEKISALAEAAFRRENRLSASDSLKKAGLFENTWKSTNNFLILSDGLRFFYNPYEIAPWTSGTIDLTIKESDFSAFLKK